MSFLLIQPQTLHKLSKSSPPSHQAFDQFHFFSGQTSSTTSQFPLVQTSCPPGLVHSCPYGISPHHFFACSCADFLFLLFLVFLYIGETHLLVAFSKKKKKLSFFLAFWYKGQKFFLRTCTLKNTIIMSSHLIYSWAWYIILGWKHFL